MSRTRIGRYEVVATLRSGPLGGLYQAYDPTLARQVAIEVLEIGPIADPAALGQFKRDAAVAARLAHPAIALVYEMGEHGGALYVAREHLEGRPLRDALSSRGPFPPAEVAAIGREVALALAHAHEQGFVHRDVRLESVWLLDDGSVKLTGFGLAKAMGALRSRSGLELRDPSLLAPEMVWGKEADARTDIYALGALLHELVSGEPLFRGSDPEEVLQIALRRPAPPLGRLHGTGHAWLERVILDCLAKDPTARPQSAAALARLLEPRASAPAAPPARATGATPAREAAARARPAVEVRRGRKASAAPVGRAQRAPDPVAALAGLVAALLLASAFRLHGPPTCRDLLAGVELQSRRGRPEVAAEQVAALLDPAPSDPAVASAVAPLLPALAAGADPHGRGLALGWSLVEPYLRRAEPVPGRIAVRAPLAWRDGLDALALGLVRRAGERRSAGLATRARQLLPARAPLPEACREAERLLGAAAVAAAGSGIAAGAVTQARPEMGATVPGDRRYRSSLVDLVDACAQRRGARRMASAGSAAVPMAAGSAAVPPAAVDWVEARRLEARCDYEAALHAYRAASAATAPSSVPAWVAERIGEIEESARRFSAACEEVERSLDLGDTRRAAQLVEALRAICPWSERLGPLEQRLWRATRPAGAVLPTPHDGTPAAKPSPPAARAPLEPSPAPRQPSPSPPSRHVPHRPEPAIESPLAPPPPVVPRQVVPETTPRETSAGSPMAMPTATPGAMPTPAAAAVAPPPVDAVLLAACAAARGGRHAEAARILDRAEPQLLEAGPGDALAGVVYFNASYLAVKGGRCGEGLSLALKAAAHDDPWRLPSNGGWLRTLQVIPRCSDFNLTTSVLVITPKPLPDEACAVAPR